MLLSKAVPEGLKHVEYEHGIGGKNSPIHYMPEQDPIQDALKTKKKSNHFKLTLPETRSEMRVAIWASGTPEHFLIHVHGAVNIIQQMGLDSKFNKADDAVENLRLDLDIAKDAYSKAESTKRRRKRTHPIWKLRQPKWPLTMPKRHGMMQKQ